jgi:uncharacterized membrane protein
MHRLNDKIKANKKKFIGLVIFSIAIIVILAIFISWWVGQNNKKRTDNKDHIILTNRTNLTLTQINSSPYDNGKNKSS